MSSSVNGAKTTYLVDANRPYAQVLEEYEDENVKVSYVHGLDLISVEQDGEVSTYLVDGLGSTRVLVDESREVVAGYTYDAFGELISESGDVENSYLFAGEQFDGELEQYYLRDRYYDAGVGRFTRRDVYEGRIGEPITLHKYLYGNANPVNYVDPSGLYSQTFGYAVEDEVERVYRMQHPVHDVTFGRYARPTDSVRLNIKPDIFDRTMKSYNEIKPLNLNGIYKGVEQMVDYTIELLPYNYSPNVHWYRPPNLLVTSLKTRGLSAPIIIFNVLGLLFYTDNISLESRLRSLRFTGSDPSQLRNLLPIATTAAAYSTIKFALPFAVSSINTTLLSQQLTLAALVTR